MMLGARTAAWSGKALPYLRRVAYLESHGTEWLDTGIIPTKATSCKLDGQFRRAYYAFALAGRNLKRMPSPRAPLRFALG